MSDDPAKPASEADKDLEREIRADRTFSLDEAIGRMAGPGMMKGVSPVTRKQQAEAVIQEYLDQNLSGNASELRRVVFRQMKESALLLNNMDQPLVALAGFVRRVLDSEYLLEELVREADMEWGRVFEERPHFEVEGRPPHPDDPYTKDSVRTALTQLIMVLEAGGPFDQPA